MSVCNNVRKFNENRISIIEVNNDSIFEIISE